MIEASVECFTDGYGNSAIPEPSVFLGIAGTAAVRPGPDTIDRQPHGAMCRSRRAHGWFYERFKSNLPSEVAERVLVESVRTLVLVSRESAYRRCH